MKLTREHVHKSIFERMNALAMGFHVQTEGSQSEWVKAYSKHQKIWWKLYGKGFFAWTAGFGAAFTAAILYNNAGGPLGGLAVGGVVSAALVAMGVGFYRNMYTLAPAELEALLPALDFDPIELAYCRCLIALGQNKAVDEAGAIEILRELNSLLDWHAALKVQRESIRASFGDDRVEEASEEVRRLEERIQSTTDATARDSFQTGLQLAKRRLEAMRHNAPLLDRIESQEEVVRQTMLAVQADIARSRGEFDPAAEVDLDALRRNVASVTSHSEAIEAAVREVNALG